MRKFFLLLLLAPLLFSSDLKTEQKIYGLIIHSLLPNKESIKVWSDNKTKENILRSIKGVVYVNSSDKADFLLLSQKENLHTKGIKFVTNYQLLEDEKNSVVGGFFWQKGRPNILFLRKNLQKHHIKLPQSMQDYIEDDL